ncbi:MAG: PHP domain-containing protein [Athalassotoga sp.]
MDDRSLFILFLEMAGFNKKESESIFNDFKESEIKMDDFVKLRLSRKSKNIFEQLTLIKFATAYDDPVIRKDIEYAIDQDFSHIKGDLHIHTNWSDGSSSIKQIADEAKKIGYKYIAITDHSLVGKGKVEMDQKKFMKQIEEIDNIQRFLDIKIIKGIEIDINVDGSLDYTDDILKNADIVIGSVHFDYGQGPTKALELLEKLFYNQSIDIIAHPLNKIGKECFLNNFDKLLYLAEKNMKIFEINLSPDRIRESIFLVDIFKDSDVMFSFGTDSHSRKQMRLMSLSNLWNSMINEKMILNTYEDPISLLKKR